jgi:hypothetical protein
MVKCKNLTLEQMLHLNKEGFVQMFDFLDDNEYIAIVQDKHVYMKSEDKYIYIKTLEKVQNGKRFY